MKKLLPGLLLGLVLGAAATRLLLAGHREPTAATETAAPAEEKPAARAGLHFTNEQVVAAGLQLAPPTMVSSAPEIEAFGRVLDPTPLVTAAAEVATAQATVTASQKEFARVKALHDEGNNASVQAVETAEAAARRDQVQLDAARARFTAAWGPALAARLDTGLIAEAVEKGWALGRLDVPPGEATLAVPPKSAKVSLLAGGDTPSEVEVLGPAPTADPQLQGRGYLVLLRDQPLPAGAALRATLPAEGTRQLRPVLPRSAFVRHEGSVFVFVQTGPATFERHRVELGRPFAKGVAVDAGVGPKDQVVVVGAQQLLSTQLSGAGSED